jgi:hypothetical protein
MNIFRKISFCLVIIFSWRMDVFANSGASSDNPYAQIVTRNVFALDTSVSSASSTPSKPLPTITPNGIMSVFGSVQTLFKVTDNQFGQPVSEKSYILGEGQREDDIKVVRIDEKNAVVTFNNHGTIQELPLVAATASGNVGPNCVFQSLTVCMEIVLLVAERWHRQTKYRATTAISLTRRDLVRVMPVGI